MNIKLILGILIIISSFKIKACECIIIKDVKEEINSSDYVAVGKVLKIEKIYFTDSIFFKELINSGISADNISKTLTGRFLTKVTLNISNIYKGSQKNKIQVVYTGMGDSDCGFHFRLKKRYIIYAKQNSWLTKELMSSYPKLIDVLSTDICTRTKKINRKEIRQIKETIK